MHIEPGQIIAGQPALHIRDLLLYASRHWDELRLEDVQGVLDVDAATAQQIINDLEAQGYIELNEAKGIADNEQRSWRNTLQGNALAFASARPPVKRATAERVLTAFLQRVQQVNANSTFAYRVRRVVVFGSYLSDSPSVHDIDLCVWLVPAHQDKDEQHQHARQRINEAHRAGRRFAHDGMMYAWPLLEVWQFLRNRSATLALHDGDAEGILNTGVQYKVLYQAEEAEK